MKVLLRRHKFIYSFLFLIFVFGSAKMNSQALGYSVTPGQVCYTSGGTNTVLAFVTGTSATAASFTWALQGPPTCTPTYTNAVPNGSVITITYPCCGTYTLIQFAFTAGATLIGSYTNSFIVVCAPVISISGNTVICSGGNSILNASGASSYTWTNGPSTYSTNLTPTVTTNYTVTGTAGFCTNTAVQSISVNPLPVISVVASPSTLCAGGSATLFAGGANTYTWSGGITSPSLVVSPSATHNYTVIGANATGCIGTAVQGIIVNPSPTVIIPSGNSTVCPGIPVNLAAIGAQSYTWNIGATSQSIIVTPSVTSPFFVHGTNSSGCIGGDTIIINIIPTVLAGFTYTNSTNGQVNFTNTSSNLSSNTTYSWNFGNGLISTGISPSTTYTSNGIYTVSLIANSGCGPNTITQTISITNITGPACASNFTFITLSPGNYSFVSTSAGTNSSTTYSWNFGNGSVYSASASAGIHPPVQTYTNGTYLVNLFIINTSPFCTDSFGFVINVCALDPNFTHIQLAGNTVNFISTSTNTLPTTTYSWNYGDGGLGSGSNSSHTYSATGNYTVTLTATNNFSCTSTKNITITVSSCNLGANFTHTVGLYGAVQFSNTSSNTDSLTNYFWNFGDGVYSNAANPSHTYNNAGNHYVTLKINNISNSYCLDSLTQSINVTGISCVANSYFSIVPTLTLHYWVATPNYPYNITAATWYWGDGSHNDSLYTSHMYASPGTYTICLSVTVSCGASSSYCYSYAVNKSDQESSQIVYINIAPPALSTGITNIKAENLSYILYPNPNNGEFNINIQEADNKNLTLTVFNLVGETVYTSELESRSGSVVKTIHLDNVVKGIYFVKLISGTKTFTQKIIISE